MQLISYLGDGGPRVAGVRGEEFFDVQEADATLPSDMKSLLALGREGLEKAAAAIAKGPALTRKISPIAPVPNPQKVFCVGLNYADHAAESGAKVGDEPVIFSKFPTCICGPNDTILLPKVGAKVDYEAELVIVIGKRGKNIPHEQALEHVAGYCCGHDVSARDWQKHKPGGQWTLGKGFDTFAPLGPVLVTADEVGDPENLRIQLRLNGETMQDSNTSQLIFKVAYLVEYLSRVATLEPGDVIFTGTPPGVGFARKPPVYLKSGDVVEVEIERLGVLHNTVANEK